MQIVYPYVMALFLANLALKFVSPSRLPDWINSVWVKWARIALIFTASVIFFDSTTWNWVRHPAMHVAFGLMGGIGAFGTGLHLLFGWKDGWLTERMLKLCK